AAAELAFAYDPARNGFVDLPSKDPWSTAVGVAFGADENATAVLAWTDTSAGAFLSEEWVGPKGTIAGLVCHLRSLIDKHNTMTVAVTVFAPRGPPGVCERGGAVLFSPH